MPGRLLERFKNRRMILSSAADCPRDTPIAAVPDHDAACRRIRPMFDFWQSLLAALERIAMLPSLIHSVFTSLPSRKRMRDAVRTYDRTMDDLLREIQALLESPLAPAKLLHMSGKLQEQFAPKLQASDICMLPSYNDTLPTGLEQGTYLALDVGGSTFRVAVVELNGKHPGAKSMRIVTMKSYKIDNTVRNLRGIAFFDWMAEKIEAALSDPQVQNLNGTKTFGMGLAWSFPVEYVVPTPSHSDAHTH
jgi:hexokinase